MIPCNPNEPFQTDDLADCQGAGLLEGTSNIVQDLL